MTIFSFELKLFNKFQLSINLNKIKDQEKVTPDTLNSKNDEIIKHLKNIESNISSLNLNINPNNQSHINASDLTKYKLNF